MVDEKTLSGGYPTRGEGSLREIVEYIKKDSPSAAIKDRKKLIEIAKSLNELPERFSNEEYLLNKTGNYRSVIHWHYKIIYKVLEGAFQNVAEASWG